MLADIVVNIDLSGICTVVVQRVRKIRYNIQTCGIKTAGNNLYLSIGAPDWIPVAVVYLKFQYRFTE